jgi:transcriptional regulator with XRE-family HTH domain
MEPVRLGNAFRALRIRKRWRQEDLAARIGVSRQLISKIESGGSTSSRSARFDA